MREIIYPKVSYKIVGNCMEVHRHLGPGFLEIVYKDALEREFAAAGIPYSREKKFEVFYKGRKLRHDFYADFTVCDRVIVEVKAVESFHDVFFAQCLNYLKVSGYRLAILVNFGQSNLQYKRFVL